LRKSIFVINWKISNSCNQMKWFFKS